MNTEAKTNQKPVALPARDELSIALEALARLLEYPGADWDNKIRDAQTALHIWVVEDKSNASFPLTPALSLGEREQHSPFVGQAVASRLSMPSVREPADGGVEARDFETTTARPLLSPLPEGEGQGEGNRSVDLCKAWTAFERFRRTCAALSEDEREELHTATFDVTPACIPYVSIHLFGEENFKRGEFMAALHARYQEIGFDYRGELPDHVGVLLRFAAIASEEERRELTQFCLLGPLAKMVAALGSENPCRLLLETVIAVLRAAHPGMDPAPSPWEQMQRHGGGCLAITPGCGCSVVPCQDPLPANTFATSSGKTGPITTVPVHTDESHG